MLFVDQNKQFSDLRKNKNCSTYIINNLSMALAANIIIMNPINNKLYILKNTAETIEQFDLEETNNERSQNPYVYLYPTEYTVSLYRVKMYIIKQILEHDYLLGTIS